MDHIDPDHRLPITRCKPFLEALDERVLVCDGAMGTMLYAKGVFINKSFDALNLTQPELVAEVHQEYVRAGADIIETNTFGANRIKLGSFGLADRLHAINAQGAQIARAGGARAGLRRRRDRSARASASSRGARPASTRRASTSASRRRRSLDGGVDLFILETFRDLNEIGAAIDAVRSVSDLPIVAQMTTEEDGNTLDGTPPERFAPELERRGATSSASTAPSARRRCSRRSSGWRRSPGCGCRRSRTPASRATSRAATSICARPSTWRRTRGGSSCTTCAGRRLLRHDAGAHPADQGGGPRRWRRRSARAGAPAAGAPTRPRVDDAAIAAPPVAREQKSRLAQRAGAQARSSSRVELLPPRGFQTDAAIERARQLKARGVDVDQHPRRPARRRAA